MGLEDDFLKNDLDDEKTIEYTEDMRIAVRINRSVEWIMVIIVVATATCMYVIPSFF